jgi:bifunctional isochorismate lyase/aryl carrier protein
MGMTRIDPYPMPTEADLPTNVAAWRPDPARAALLIHDMQRYFVRAFAAGQPPVTDLLANVARIRRAARRLDLPVIYTAQPGAMSRARRGLLFDFWGPGMSAHPDDRAIVAELAPGPDDLVVTKLRYSAFHGCDLAGTIRALGRDQLVVCGVYAHVGCLMTACDAFAHDIWPFLVADAVADLGPGHHRQALEYAAGRCAVTLTTSRLLSHLGAGHALGAGHE